MTKTIKHVQVRLPLSTWKWIKKQAKQNKRSMNSEIVSRLRPIEVNLNQVSPEAYREALYFGLRGVLAKEKRKRRHK